MFKEVYLNRAIAYLKEAYELARGRNYTENVNTILGYRLKASDDLFKYFEGVLEDNININSEKMLREKLLLFWHSDDASSAV